MSLLGALTHTQKCSIRDMEEISNKPQPLQFFYYKLFNKLLVIKSIFFCNIYFLRSAGSGQWSAVSNDDGRVF